MMYHKNYQENSPKPRASNRPRNQKTLLLLLIPALMLMGGLLSARPVLKNIIIISVDTLRADHLHCYGYPLETSPHIDSLARDGVRFSNCYTLTPLTAPAFSTVFTSLPPYKHGSKRNGLGLYRNVKTFLFNLKRYGYHNTAIISNWPLRKKLSGLDKNFDAYHHVFTRKRYLGLTNSEGGAPAVNRKALEWLENKSRKRSFLWLHYTDPHAPYIKHKNFTFDYKSVDSSVYPPGTRMKKIKRYDSEIAYTDDHIGRFINRLKAKGLYKDSLIIFISDHGESFGEHNYLKHGRKLYNSTLHVPMIVKLPGNQLAGAVRSENVSLMDVAPTIFSLLNMMRPSKMEGMALFNSDEDLSQRRILLETYGGQVLFKRKSKKYHLKIKPIRYGIVQGNTKLIYNYKKKTYEVYILTKDPFEVRNVSTDLKMDWGHQKDWLSGKVEKVTDYIKLSRRLRTQKNSLSQKDFDMLKSLGYVD